MQWFEAAKSSISEDLDIIDAMFDQLGIGRLQTSAGAAGGVQYIPDYHMDLSKRRLMILLNF